MVEYCKQHLRRGLFNEVGTTQIALRLASLTILSSLIFSMATQAPAQSQHDIGERAFHIVVEEPQVLDERLLEKGITGRSLAETLRFVLSTYPELTTALAGQPNPPASQVPVFRLSSSIYKFQNSAVWSGDILGQDGKSRRIGPVTVTDDAGLKSGALNDIAALTLTHLRQPFLGDTRGISVVSCVVHKGTMAASIVQDFQARLRSRIESTAGVYWQGSSARSCTVEPRAPDNNVALLSGQIEARNDNISIKPTLSWRSIPSLPLAWYRGSFDSYISERDEYLTLIARSVSSLLNNEYPPDSISEALNANTRTDSEAAREGRLLLRAGYAFLAIPLLQRGEMLGQTDLLFDLGIAFRDAGASVQAAKIFERVIRIDDSHGGAHKELGISLFNQRKYKEAAQQFERAGNIPGAREKYASVLYLLDDRQGARKKAVEAVKAGEGSPDLDLLLAQLDMSDKKFGDAVLRLKDGFGGNLESAYISALKVLTRVATEEKDFTAADDAFKILIARAPSADNFLLYARAIMARAQDTGFADHAVRAVEMFRKALDKNRTELSQNPQFSVVPLELAEALFVAGDEHVFAAREVASEFLFADAVTDADKAKLSTRTYAPVARLFIVASEYLTRRAMEPPLRILERDLVDPLPYPELYVSVARPVGDPVRFRVARWSFKTFDKYVCTKLSPSDRDVVLALSTTLQRKVGQDVTDGCDRTGN